MGKDAVFSIAVVLNSRAAFPRLLTLLRAIQGDPAMDLRLVCLGSAVDGRFSDVPALLAQEGMRATTLHTLESGDALGDMVRTTARTMDRFTSYLEDTAPDAVLVHADRYETLGIATAANYMNIPLIHTQGGEISGSVDNSVRWAITALADLHLACTLKAYGRLVRLKNGAHRTGCPSIDLAASEVTCVPGDIDKYGAGDTLDYDAPFLLLAHHPDTRNYDELDVETENLVHHIATSRLPVVWIRPNCDAGREHIAKPFRRLLDEGLEFGLRAFRNLHPLQYYFLMRRTVCMVGNSSSAIREGAYLATPAVMLGERQKGREYADNAVFCRDFRNFNALLDDRLQWHRVPNELYGNGRGGKNMHFAISEWISER